VRRRAFLATPLAICVVPVLSLSVLGCASIARKATEKAIENRIEKESGGKARVNVEKGSVEVETEEGKTRVEAGEGARLPENFPKDVPVYEGAKVASAITQDEGGSVSFTVSAGFRDVSDFYRSALQKAGYKVEATMDLGETAQFVATSADGKRQVSIQAAKDKDGTSLVIIYGAK